MSNSFEIKLNKLLTTYVKEVDTKTRKIMERVAKEAKVKLQNDSRSKFKGRGDYAKGWRVKKEGRTITVHNATEYRLTHLLENGHVIRNQYGTYGRTRATPHIKPVEQWAQQEVEKTIKKEIGS